MNSAHGPCACAAPSRSNATSCSAWWHSRSIKYSASRSSGPRLPERRPLRPREHRENSPRSMNFARGSIAKNEKDFEELLAIDENGLDYTPTDPIYRDVLVSRDYVFRIWPPIRPLSSPSQIEIEHSAN